MRGAALIVMLAVLACCAVGSSTASATALQGTQLKIAYWPNGTDEGPMRTWTLRCDPAGGTLVRPGRACLKLASLRNPFARPSLDQMCTQQYGGPDEAQITGTYRGRRIWVALSLTDGCQIARFRALSFLVPGFS
jgi:subtilisin inhibitor-like